MPIASESYLSDCTETQRAAITHPGGPLLVLAGAGSGKTRVITRRIAHLVATGASPHDILAITFTNKAADEMKERVEKLCGRSEAGRDVWLSTFHSMCARILRRYADRLGYTQAFSIYDDSDRISVIKRAMKEMNISSTDHPPPVISRMIGSLKNDIESPAAFTSRAQGPFQENVAKIFAAYEEALRANNALDFDDLLIKVVELFKTAPDVRERYAQRFRHILIDEYQDTNHAQYLIATALASLHRNICVTGDPDQSIYGWRGADLSNILEFERDYPDATIIKLEQNYRSTKVICQAANHVIARNEERMEKELRTDNAEGVPLRVRAVGDETQEARFIAEDVARRIAGGGSYDNVAVFYRTNAQSRNIETAMNMAGIPHVVVAGVSFYERVEVKDVIAYLRVCANPADNESLQRIANVPARGLGRISLDKLRADARSRSTSLLEVMQRIREMSVAPAVKAGVEQLLAVIRAVREAGTQPVAEQVKLLLDKITYIDHVKSSYEDADDRIQNCMEIVNLADQYDSQVAAGLRPEDSAGGLNGFLEAITLVSDQDNLDKAHGVVRLMTLHTAKGLEFPTVYITGLEEGLLPLETSDGRRDLEEERRLFFVGLTRAKHEVVLTYALTRRKFGQTQYCQPSRFIEEIPQSIVQTTAAFREGPPLEIRGDAPARIERSADDSPRDSTGLVLREGDRVRHPSFGAGVILSLSGSTSDPTARVRFASQGEKTLILRYARLDKVTR